ncbi:SPW repeat protein [Massilia sp. RP-1-19]|uniref:SPW repeat protein n=1 Tax=Massilia polaris TaxID=2728846 RepID=A0A848HT11_9BURK|nr:SPW repeat protein [Massilia polaris]NML63230.1 SPW repeat protein [Massilia polaris]
MALHFSARRWQDQVILLLGAWLCVSPWVLGMPSDSPRAINAYAVGAAMAVLAAFDLYKTYLWAVAANLLLAAWIAISPWVPAFFDRGAMMTNSVIVGVAVVMLGLWELKSDPDLHRQWAGTGGAH